ncbi:MAG: hypothetical protein HPY57_14015 [Ignavibacteria bacterium]|nr:hypothetical protein [Ignavibacteria bacterium]
MKETLILKKFKKEPVYGTFNLLEEETFFGSKIMELEDQIIINDKSVQYFQYFFNALPGDITGQTLAKNNGYQYSQLNKLVETFYLLDMVDLKLQNHAIYKATQTSKDEKYNTKWVIDVNIKNILREYLFAKIKERRTFKSITHDRFLNKDINKSIYEYIDVNLLDRYSFQYIDFYIRYVDIKNNTVWLDTTFKQFDPQFRSDIELDEYKNQSVNVEIANFIDPLANLKINYFQTKPSTDYKFDYYFNIYYKKI